MEYPYSVYVMYMYMYLLILLSLSEPFTARAVTYVEYRQGLNAGGGWWQAP